MLNMSRGQDCPNSSLNRHSHNHPPIKLQCLPHFPLHPAGAAGEGAAVALAALVIGMNPGHVLFVKCPPARQPLGGAGEGDVDVRGSTALIEPLDFVGREGTVVDAHVVNEAVQKVAGGTAYPPTMLTFPRAANFLLTPHSHPITLTLTSRGVRLLFRDT